MAVQEASGARGLGAAESAPQAKTRAANGERPRAARAQPRATA